MSANDPKHYNGENRQSTYEIVNAEAIAQRDLVAVNHGAHATSANRGRCEGFDDGGIHHIVTGFAERGETGDTTADVPPSMVSSRNAGDLGVELAVTGAAGTSADIGKIVYATDEDSFTFTPTARCVPVGWVSRAVSSGRAIVALWDGPMLSQYATRYDYWTFLVPLLGTDTAKTFGQVYVPRHVEIVSTEAIIITAPAGASATSTLTFRRDPLDAGSGQVAVTGGGITLATGDTEGELIAGAAVTGTAELHEGDRLEALLTITADGTFTAGLAEVRVYVRNLLGT